MSMKRIWQLAWPVMLSNVTVPFLGMVDIAVVGHDYPAYVLGAVAIGSMAFDVCFLLFGFLRMSTTGLVAQKPDDSSILYRALLTACVIALCLIVFQKLLFMLLISVMHTSNAVTASLHDYFYLRIYASPMTLGNFVLLGYFFGRQNTKIPLILLMLTNLSAIGLDFILVRYLAWGVSGLAIANILAQSLGFFVGLWCCFRLFKPKRVSFSTLLDIEAIQRLFHLNKDIFIRTLCLMSVFAYFTMAGSHLGTSVVAANAILLSMQHFIAYGLDGFAIACETLVGRAIGNNDKSALLSASTQCAYFSGAIALLFSLFFWIKGDALIHLLSSLPEVVSVAKHYLVWVIWLPLLSVGGFLLDGIFIGATWSKPMRNTMLFSTLLVYFPCVLLLKTFGNTGLWASFSLFMFIRGLSLAYVFMKKVSSE
ncbi:MAG: MATE family efflux transporter [Legionellaceae bacterium]|nr:MATE family efflux transporter [Legionellaceae bacterium]